MVVLTALWPTNPGDDDYLSRSGFLERLAEDTGIASQSRCWLVAGNSCGLHTHNLDNAAPLTYPCCLRKEAVWLSRLASHLSQ